MPSTSTQSARGGGKRRGGGYSSCGRGASTKAGRPKAAEAAADANTAKDVASSSEEELDDAQQANEANLASCRPRVHLCLWEFGQNDPKVDSGSRLVRRGIARAMKPQ